MSNKVSVGYIIEKLGLQDAPVYISYSTVLHWATFSDGIRLYADSALRATKFDSSPEETFDELGEFTGFLLATGEPENIGNEKQLTLAYLGRLPPNGTLLVRSFLSGGHRHYCCDEEGMFLEDQVVSIDYVYAKSDEFDDFQKKAISAKLIKGTKPAGDIALQKAVAVLAASMSESTPKYRTGNKVNASAVRDRIIELAESYGISTGNLKKFDEKLNAILKQLDLKEPAHAKINADK